MPWASVVAKMKCSPPSFSFSFLRKASGLRGKLRVAMLALLMPCKAVFRSRLLKEVVATSLNRRPGKVGMSLLATKRCELGAMACTPSLLHSRPKQPAFMMEALGSKRYMPACGGVCKMVCGVASASARQY